MLSYSYMQILYLYQEELIKFCHYKQFQMLIPFFENYSSLNLKLS